MSDRATVTQEHAVPLKLSSQESLPSLVRKLIDELEPGDRLDFDDIPANLKEEFIDEFDGRGYFLSSCGKVGMVEECSVCDGVGQMHGEDCLHCEGMSLLVSQGRGWEPFRD